MSEQPKTEFYCLNPMGHTPRFKHTSQEDAIAEAERLVHYEGVSEVHILKSVGVVRPTHPPVEFLECVEEPQKAIDANPWY